VALGSDHVLVDPQGTPRAARHDVEDAQHARLAGLVAHEAGGRDRARVDHRVEGPAALLKEADAVGAVAGRRHADLVEHAFETVVLQSERVGVGLGDRLDGELFVGLADGVDAAVGGDDGDAEGRRIGSRELGNVAGDLAGRAVDVTLVELLQVGDERVLGLGRIGGGRGRLGPGGTSGHSLIS
jgi:hypothetical protein